MVRFTIVVCALFFTVALYFVCSFQMQTTDKLLARTDKLQARLERVKVDLCKAKSKNSNLRGGCQVGLVE